MEIHGTVSANCSGARRIKKVNGLPLEGIDHDHR
jgi:hypothetical protein